MISLTLAELATACRGQLTARDPSVRVDTVSTDSRTVVPGSVFIALHGQHFDGGDFAADAVDRGAAVVVVRAETAATLPSTAAHVTVEDGLMALWSLASALRRHVGARVVAITGSTGKTITKDILASLLRPVAKVVATAGNYNNEVGVPLTMLALEADSQVLVVELAMRGLGQIGDLARVVRPDIGVITNVAPVHLELVGSVENVAAAKAELILELQQGTMVVPGDEPLLEPYLRQGKVPVVTFGPPGNDLALVDAVPRDGGTRAIVDAFGRRVALQFNFTGEHYLNDALAALGAFVTLGFPLEAAREGAGKVAFSALRGEVVQLSGGGVLLNDAYNANPLSMRAALDHLVSLAGERPRVAVLGEMYELGPGAETFHREVGEYAAGLGVRVLAVGDLGRAYLVGGSDERWYATVEECVAALPGALPPGSAVLVKASRAMRLERVAETIRNAFLEDDGGEGGGHV